MNMKCNWADKLPEDIAAVAIQVARRQCGFIADAFLSDFIFFRRGDESLIFPLLKGNVRDSSPRLLLFQLAVKPPGSIFKTE
jgi:hypothetical protein